MPSTYSPSLKIELIGNGEQTGTWGQTTNNNMGTLLEQAIAGVGSLSLSGDYVLSNYNGLPDEARNAVLVFSGSLAASANVIAPSVQKTYIITNNAGANVTVKTSTGNGITVQNGLSALIYCDSTDFYTAVNVNNVIGDLSVSGNETIAGYVTVGGSLTFANSITNTTGNLTFTANSSIIDMSVNTKALVPPTGTTAQRPSSPQVGMARWNTTTSSYEIWNGSIWQVIASGSYDASIVVVAGGGGAGPYAGGSGVGAGGGAGGVLVANVTLGSSNQYIIVVGAGGSAGNHGVDSSGFGQLALGGGYGGIVSNGGAGGSGGGGGGAYTDYSSGGAGTSGQGNAGAGGTGFNQGNYAGGGGGKGAAGSGPNGGNGIIPPLGGVTAYYGGGGGGWSNGTGGLGGGAPAVVSGSGIAGTANTGGGGGGSNSDYNGGAGGSGVVIISYLGAQRGTGGTVTSNQGYTLHTFTSSGTFVA